MSESDLILGQCGCGEEIEMVDGVWQHLRRRLDRHHTACVQLTFELEPYQQGGS